jgi:tetratricopeptide (TPR) repeat protein
MRYVHRTDPADLERAARYSERAIELDPELGEPYPWLSYAYMRQGKVEQAVRTGHKGVERQPDLVLSHYFLAASYMCRSETDIASYQPAVKHFLDATLTDPRWGATWLCLGHIAVACGEYDRAEEFLLNLREIERRGPGFGFFLGSEMILATIKQRRGDKEGAREMCAASTATLESRDHVYREAFLALTACGLGDLLLREGRADAALTEFRRASRLVKEYPRMLGRQRVLARTLAGMGAVQAALGETSHARQSLEEAAQHLTEIARNPQAWVWEGFLGQLYWNKAAAHQRLGESDLALDSLERAVGYGWRDTHWLASDPDFIALRDQPRFQALQEYLNLLPALEFKPNAGISASPIGTFALRPV